ncbi:ABC transporter permease [Isobaculum melis]|uniref:ABC-2 family transporter protein n=1 Tax=Isobaculum melis TaxID=142588 RepID=A0A1H9SZY1_9LACT|nr:ABC transporter permease [Isobaculum melis]SER90387.1 ABC-2 family transporter protein [Isobaculum melis]
MLYLLNSEWTKFRSYRWCLFGAMSAILIAPMMLFFTTTGKETFQLNDWFSNFLQGLNLGQVGIIIAAAAFFGQEYTHKALRTTFLAVPTRLKVLLAKSIMLFIIVLVTIAISIILCLIVAISQPNEALTMTFLLKMLGQIALIGISWLQLAMIAASLTILTKSLIVPIAILFSLILGVSRLLFLVSTTAKYLPDLATMNLFLMNQSTTFLEIGEGMMTQFGWLALLGTVAVYLTYHRDVQ